MTVIWDSLFPYGINIEVFFVFPDFDPQREQYRNSNYDVMIPNGINY